MVVRDIRILLEKLDLLCVKVLERSVGGCVNRGHYEVRWEHLFVEFLDEPESEIPYILRRFQVETAGLRKTLAAELETMRTGNTGRPAFSPPLLEVMEEAWSLATLAFGLQKITSGTLLVAALDKGRYSLSSYADQLRTIDVEVLKADFRKITAATQEAGGSAAEERTPAGAPPAAMTPEAAVEVLKKYCTNFTELARSGKIDPILGRDDEIRSSLDILSRRRKNNPILVGEAGVGKTAIVEGIALRIAANDVPDHLKGVDLWGLDLGLLQAGASVKGEFEKRLKSVIDAIKGSATPTILFIDEAHTLIGAGGSAGQNDAANLLKPALARGELRTMAATTWAEYRKYFEKDPALARRFQLVKIEEPDEETCSIMLRGVSASYEKHHNVTITHDGVKAAVTYSHRYISGRQLPDKAVDVLDTACTRVKMSQSAKPGKIDGKERDLENTRKRLGSLEKDKAVGIPVEEEEISACRDAIASLEQEIATLNEKWKSEQQAVTAVLEARAKLIAAREAGDNDGANCAALEKANSEALDRLAAVQGEEPMVFSHVSAPLCGQVISDWTGIPIGSLVKDEAAALLALEEHLRQRVVGQEYAVTSLADAIRSAKTGMTNPDAPLGVFFFCGPSGVGKTELALALADELFGSDRFLTVINMSEYQEKHTVSQLKGSPPGYVGYGEGGILTEAVRQKPYSVVLLDEVEKAHLEVMNLFYQVFDKGFMRDGEGREINFRNTVIIMTSNLASDVITDRCAGEDPAQDRELVDLVKPALIAHFQPALIGRCTILPFRPLSDEALTGIVAIKLDKIARRMHDVHKLTFSCSPALVERIVQACSSSETGARAAQTIIDQQILPGVSRQLLTHMGEEGKHYTRLHIGTTDEGDFEIVFAEEGDMVAQEREEQEKEQAQETEPAGAPKRKNRAGRKP
ncbi:MAG: type VI secretion system ATPase TssH [Chitinispirillaceae bacterium]|nr:type VI secretion system ATPase TssH [Chitinispirillaceae bacterium]